MTPLALYEELHRRGKTAVLIIPGRKLMWAGPANVKDLEPDMARHYDDMQALAHEFEAPPLAIDWCPELAVNAARKTIKQARLLQPQPVTRAPAPRSLVELLKDWEPKVNAFEYQLLTVIAKRTDSEGAAKITYATLCRELRIPGEQYNRVAAAIYSLERQGALSVVRQEKKANVYRLMPAQPSADNQNLIDEIGSLLLTLGRLDISEGGWAHITHEQFAESLGTTKLAIQMALRTMETNGLLEIEKRPGHSNGYRLKGARVTL